MNIAIVKTFVKKEFKQIIRDISSILIAFILPLILLFLFGFGVNFDTNTVKIGIVDQSNSVESRNFIQSLKNTKYLDTSFYKTTNEAEKFLIGGKIRSYVVIPVNYEIELKKKLNPKIQIITDGTEPNTAKFASTYIQGAYFSNLQYENSRKGNLEKTKTISAINRSWYNPALKSTYFILPGSLAIIMTMTGTILTALVIAREWERGTMEAILTTNITKGEFILAKYIAYFVLGFLSILFCLFLIIVVFKVPFRGSYIALFITSSLFMLTGLGVGLLISTTFKDQFTSSQIAGTIGFMPSMMLSGLIYEIDSMPFLIRTISNVIPAKYYVSAATSLFLSGTILKIIIFNSIYMLIFATLTAILIYKNTTERLENC
ncbi:TPA: ABC transporter permease [Candidatus Galligastranaerophilus intestinigallinarum]|nr:ABC transporter permease [Candidatus Galligastranaerophilus intestinigallinarum]